MEWIQAIGPTLLVVIGGIISWFIKDRAEELRAVEERLQDDRRRIYAEILDPYIQLFTSLGKDKNQTKVLRQIATYEYRKASFQLVLVGNDEVVRAYNKLWQHAYKAEASGSGGRDATEMLRLFGVLLLQIRRSLRSQRKRLRSKDNDMDEWDMLEWIIKDIEVFRSPE